MSAIAPPEIKKALLGHGLEVYRTRGHEVHIADRVRDNLILDSGVAVGATPHLYVRFVVRAQKSDFPHERVETLFSEARGLATSALARGFAEQAAQITPVTDPVDPSRTLDTWFEVLFQKAVASLDEAIVEARFALGLQRHARPVDP